MPMPPDVESYLRSLAHRFNEPDLREAAKDVERLRADVKFWNETAIEYKRQLNETIRRGPESAGLNIITTDQINAAWEFNEDSSPETRAHGRAMLYSCFGIVPCEKCGGMGVVRSDWGDHMKECDCPNNGWVMEGR